MIARTWHGATRAADAETYARYIESTGMKAFAETHGNAGALLLTRQTDDGAETEFLVISFWESEDAVKRFAGPTPERAVFYPADERYLVRRDMSVTHYEVVARHDAVESP